MPPRLTEQYRIGDAVVVYLAGDFGEEWQPGVVMLLQHPGVWVQTGHDRRLWYVTNGRRIRPFDEKSDAAANDQSVG